MRYLGKIILERGYSMDPEDTAAAMVLKERRPATVGKLRKILGFVGYYCYYIKDFSCHAKILYDLLSPQGVSKGVYQRSKKGS